jgi:hypothetical protein
MLVVKAALAELTKRFESYFVSIFIAKAAHAELTWLNEREDRETGRDWADRNLNLTEVEQYYEVRFSFMWCKFRTFLPISFVGNRLKNLQSYHKTSLSKVIADPKVRFEILSLFRFPLFTR